MLTVVGAGLCVKDGVVNPLGASVGATCATIAIAAVIAAAVHKKRVDFRIMLFTTPQAECIFPKIGNNSASDLLKQLHYAIKIVGRGEIGPRPRG